jgi:hypothetical protein
MAIEKCGSISVNYNPNNVDSEVAKDMVQIAFQESIYYPNDSFYNIAFPSLSFDLLKYNEDIGYKITIGRNYCFVPDPYLEYTKNLYNALDKKYKVSIVFHNSKGENVFTYSKRNYWVALLKNNILLIILLPIVIVLSLLFGNYLTNLVSSNVQNQTLLNIIQELLPSIIGLPISVIAFKAVPMITITKVINGVIILLTVFSFYLFTGNGLAGSLILLALFILGSIKNALT